MTKKVDALKEILEGEVQQLKYEFEDQFSSMKEYFSMMEGRFSNLKKLMMKVLDFYTKLTSSDARVPATG